MRSRIIAVCVTLGALLGTGALMQPVVGPAWRQMRGRELGLGGGPTLAAAGSGVSLALLGGFRAIVADFTWLRVFTSWQKHDLPATDALVRLVPAIDPRPVYFWLNGARIIAYDFSAWRVRAKGGRRAVTEDERRVIEHEQAQQALGHLQQALRLHPASADLWIEQAAVELNRLGDPLAAAASYRRAWEVPGGGPYYAARLSAEMLRRAGRFADALEWLVKLHPQLPPHDEAAGAAVVLARIRALEQQLGVPPEKAYVPPR